LVLLLVLVELELMGWVRKVQFLMQKLAETVTEAARQGDTEFQTGTLGSTWLHCPEELLCCSNLRNPSCKSSIIIRLLFAVHCLQQLAQAALVPLDSILQFLEKIRYLRTGPSRIDMQQSHIKSGKHTLAP